MWHGFFLRCLSWIVQYPQSPVKNGYSEGTEKLIDMENLKKIILKELSDLEDNRIFVGGSFNKLSGKIHKHVWIGLYKLVIGEKIDARYHLYKATYIECLILDIFFKKIYPNIEYDRNTILLSGHNWYGLNYAINVGDESILRRFLEPLVMNSMDHKGNYNTLAILIKKGLVLNDTFLVDSFLPLLLKKKVSNLRGYEKGDYQCLLGIVNGDMAIFNEGISTLTKTFKREEGILVESGLSLWATGNVRLARRLGFEPDLSNSFISKDLVFMDDRIFAEDDELESYIAQLNEMNSFPR